jgi:hypothetical protein
MRGAGAAQEDAGGLADAAVIHHVQAGLPAEQGGQGGGAGLFDGGAVDHGDVGSSSLARAWLVVWR